MSSAKITLIGFYTFDQTLFDGFDVLPVDKALLIDTVLMRGGEYEVIYSNGDLLKQLIESWSNRYKSVIENWLRATKDMDEVNPLDNYDRYENWTDKLHGTGSTSGNDASNASASVNNTVSAYNSNSMVNESGNTNNTNTQSTTNTNSETDTLSEHDAHIHGNIGVTTSATMYSEFMNVMGKYGNIYECIATIFLQAFVIPLL